MRPNYSDVFIAACRWFFIIHDDKIRNRRACESAGGPQRKRGALALRYDVLE